MNQSFIASGAGSPRFHPGNAGARLRLAWCTILLLALPAAPAAQVLPFRTYTINDGLPSNDVEAICQDSRGFMWFGTTEGVSVFDGVGFTTISTADGLPDDFTTEIAEDRLNPGVMWFITGYQVVRFRGDSVRRFDQRGLPVGAIHQDRTGRMWCTTEDGLLVIDGDSVRHLRTPPYNTGSYDIAETSDSVLWIIQAGAVVRHSLNSGESRLIRTPSTAVHRYGGLAQDGRGNLFVSGDCLFRLRDTGLVDWRPPGENRPNWRMAADREGNLWAGGYFGLRKYRIDRFPHGESVLFGSVNGVPDTLVRSVYVDREDNIWIGGRDGGASVLARGSMIEFPLGTLWSAHQRTIGAVDRRGHLWVIANDSLYEFSRDEDHRWARHRHDIPVVRDRDNNLGSVFVDGWNRLWITETGSGRSVHRYRIDDGRPGAHRVAGPAILTAERKIPLPFGDPGPSPLTFIVDRRGRLWLSFSSLGIARIDPGVAGGPVRFFADSAGVPTNYIRELFEDRSGNVWGAHFNAGLVRISPDDAVRRFTTADGLPDNSCWPIAQDPSGRILVGTSRGLAIIDGTVVGVISRAQGLPTDNVQAISIDSGGRTWLGTSIGLLRETAPGSLSFTTSGLLAGPGVKIMGTMGGELLWTLPSNQLRILDLASERVPSAPPPVTLRMLRVNGVERPLGEAADLAHDENTIEVSFTAIDVTGIGPSFVYRLAGAGDRWLGPTRNRSILFGHLDPGDYRFEVRAVGRTGAASETPGVLRISIAPPYWQRWWFLAACAVLLAAGVAGSVKLRTARLLREQRNAEEFSRRLIESQEQERKRLAGELHDELGQELLVMINRAQMGMRTESMEKARGHLEEVAKAGTRAIEEVRSMAFNLRPYHLEQLGLAESLRSMIGNVASSVPVRFSTDLGTIDGLVAPADEINVFRIVQECVNNIVKHSGAANASISVRSDAGGLRIDVSDDGRGIERPDAGAAGRGFGLQGVAERVRLLGGALSIDSGRGTGTRIRVSIPRGVGDGGEGKPS